MEASMENRPENSRVARERILADLRALSADAEVLLKATASDLSDKAREARARLAAAIERAKATCNDLQQETIVTAREAAQKADVLIREHPYQTAGVALVVGLLLGLAIGRK